MESGGCILNTTLIVNRLDDWFVFEDTQNDPFYLAFSLLEKLSTRPKMGLVYNRIDLIKKLAAEKSNDAIKALDQAIILLTSRSLIVVKENKKDFGSGLFISEAGVKALKRFRKEMKHGTGENKS